MFTAAMPIWAQILLDAPGAECAPAVSDSSKIAPVNPCLVLLAHGSKDPCWREPFERLYLGARRDSQSVKLAHMKFTGPTPLDVAAECAREHLMHIRALPLFMASGAHPATDVPELLQQVRERCPDMKVELTPPIGEDPRVMSLMRHMIREELHRI